MTEEKYDPGWCPPVAFRWDERLAVELMMRLNVPVRAFSAEVEGHVMIMGAVNIDNRWISHTVMAYDRGATRTQIKDLVAIETLKTELSNYLDNHPKDGWQTGRISVNDNVISVDSRAGIA